MPQTKNNTMASSKYSQSFFIILTIFLTCIQCSTLSTSGLEIVSDDNIVDMIKNNEFVIVLFCKCHCFSIVQMFLNSVHFNFCVYKILFFLISFFRKQLSHNVWIVIFLKRTCLIYATILRTVWVRKW